MRKRFKPTAEKLVPGIKESIYKIEKPKLAWTKCFGTLLWFSVDDAMKHFEGVDWHFA